MSDINGEQNATGYQSLMDQERFQEAADALIVKLEVSEDDEKRRALAYCFLQLDKPEDAIEVIGEIDSLEFRDYTKLAWGYWQLRNWEEMASALKSMLNIKETAFAYYHLAVAEARGRYNHELDEASKQIIRGYLSNAIELEDCDVNAFLWLAKIYGPTKIRDRVRVLTRALDKHPDNPQVRYKLASMYIHHEEDFTKALDTLTPLLEDGHDDEASWYSVETLIGLGRYDEAISQLESIEFDDPLNRERIKADILFRKGNLSDWLIYSEQFTDDGSSESSIRRYFRKAYFNLQNDCLDQALA